jgi:hypothetical protein
MSKSQLAEEYARSIVPRDSYKSHETAFLAGFAARGKMDAEIVFKEKVEIGNEPNFKLEAGQVCDFLLKEIKKLDSEGE